MAKVSVTGTALRSHFDEFSLASPARVYYLAIEVPNADSPSRYNEAVGQRITRYLISAECYHFSLGNAQIFSVPAHHFYHFSVLRPGCLLFLLLQRAGVHSPFGSSKRRGALRRRAL